MAEGQEHPEQNQLSAEPGTVTPATAAPVVPDPEPAQTAAPVQEQGAARPAGKSPVREWLETIVIALLVALVIRTFVIQVYVVDGESMEPTLHSGERFLVNKFVFRFRTPKPGEIVVLNDPGTPTRELIKRVVAVAGETVEVRNGVAYVDGKPLVESYINKAYPQSPYGPTKVPDGSVFVMGDNRGRSFDSRMLGPIPLNKVDGKAFFMIWPMNRLAGGPLEQPRVVGQAPANK